MQTLLSIPVLLAGASVQASAPTNGLAPQEAASRRLLWEDFDRDGLMDAYVLEPGRWDGLLRNEGGGTFREVSGEFGLGQRCSKQALAGDLDRDGASDLLLLSSTGDLTFLQGSPERGFVHSSAAVGLDALAGVVGVRPLDFDRDGWTDLQVETLAESVLLRNAEGVFVRIDLPQTEPVDARLGASVLATGGAGPNLSQEVDARGDADDSAARHRIPDRNPREALAVGGPKSVGSVGTPPAEAEELIGGTPMARAIENRAKPTTGLRASTQPTLGHLYPLSQNLFVDPSGRVGIGTTIPTDDLHVAGAARATTVNGGRTIGSDPWGIRGESANGPTNGYLGVQGTTDYEGIKNLDIAGWEVGVLGLSTGFSVSDNFGVLGHGGQAGVRGENAATPFDFAELGRSGVGIYAQGGTYAGDFAGKVRVQGELNGLATGSANLVPVAYGTVDKWGVISSGSGNVTSGGSVLPYRLTISGQYYSHDTHVTLVSANGNGTTPTTGGRLRVATYFGQGGELYVQIWDETGQVNARNGFSFLVYRP